MFDLGWTELLLIGVVALIVVGPKDLPVMFRNLGRAMAKARGMAREFQRAMEDAANESGMKDVGKDLKKATSSRNLGLDKLKEAASGWDKWEPDSKTRKTSRTAEMGPETRRMSEQRAEASRQARQPRAGASARAAGDAAAPAPDPVAPEVAPAEIASASETRQE